MTNTQTENLANNEHDGLTIEVVEDEQVANKTVTRKGVYVIPNSFTLLSLLAGFYVLRFLCRQFWTVWTDVPLVC